MRDIDGMTTEQLLAEKSRLADNLNHARCDTFAVLLLTGQLKAVMREIEKRHHAAVAAGRI